jgi:seryl-tRNA synthetase
MSTSQTDAQRELLARLLDARLLIDTGVPGVYGRGADFEGTLMAFDGLVSRVAGADGAEMLRFPPVLPRHTIEQSGYLKSFPHLAGTIFSFEGTELEAASLVERASAHEDWSDTQSMTDLILVPAACYPVYPAVGAQGRLPAGGRLIDVFSYCFRHEPSGDPARLQSFRMREHIRIGAPEDVAEWRDTWIARGQEILRMVGLDTAAETASDPFFGRGGRMLAANQREQQLKFELTAPITSVENPTAIMSFNYHQDHFGSRFEIETATGDVAHTACLGFGLERITLAMFARHGLDPATWPDEIRGALWP